MKTFRSRFMHCLMVAVVLGPWTSTSWAAPDPNNSQVSPENPPDGDVPNDTLQNETPPAGDSPEEARWKFRGMFSSSYSVNLQHPADGVNALRGYDFSDRKLKLDVLNLSLEYGLDQSQLVGGRVDLTGGSSMPRVDAASGLFRDPNTGISGTDFDIRQAYLSYGFDNQLRVDVGKFATIFGFEVMDGVDGINQNATRTFGYTYSPYTHTGMRMSYPIDPHLTVTALAVLGADNFQDNNSSLSFGGQLNYHPTSDFSLILNYLTGPEQAWGSASNRQLLDLVVNYQVDPSTALGLHALTGVESSWGPQNSTAHWNGLVGYLRWKANDHLYLGVRQEFFNDFDGIRTRTSQNVRSLTFTPEWQFTPDWIVRCDLRWDHSSAPVFLSGSDAVQHQSTIFFNHILKF